MLLLGLMLVNELLMIPSLILWYNLSCLCRINSVCLEIHSEDKDWCSAVLFLWDVWSFNQNTGPWSLLATWACPSQSCLILTMWFMAISSLSLLQIWWLIIGGPTLTEPLNTLLHLSPLVLLHRKLENLTFARAKGADLYCASEPGSHTTLLRSSKKISSICLQATDYRWQVCQSIYGGVGMSVCPYMGGCGCVCWSIYGGMWVCLSVPIWGGCGCVYRAIYGGCKCKNIKY